LSAAVDDLALCKSDDAKTAERIHDAEIVLLNKVELSRELLRSAPKLKLLAVATCAATAPRRWCNTYGD
jgi:phosphoglycerate dehydrogenase-like enzyme